jgi:putative SbcD/Mre11-related phosphoesterase
MSDADSLGFHERAVLAGNTLVVADLHLGRARASAVEAPVGDGADVLDRLESLLSAHDPETLVIAGDLLHSFDRVPRGVADRLDDLRRAARESGTRPVVVPGNHDTMLDSVWAGPTTGAHRIDEETVVVHGHETPGIEAERYLLGHDHPTIEIEGVRRPCWLRGPGGPDGTEVVMLPAFTRFASGVAVNRMAAADFQSPLVRDADALAPVVWDADAGGALSFPPLGEFRHRL